jgi:hypothetical protein
VQIRSEEGTILLRGVEVEEIGVGFAYSAEDFIF